MALRTLILALVFLAAASARAQLSCGQLVTGDVHLNGDLTCTGHGLVVGAPGIVIDLGGRRITGDGGAADFGIDNSAGHANVTVQRGRIEGFGVGVRVAGAAGNVLQRLRLSGNETGILLLTTSDAQILRSRISENFANGVDLSTASGTLVERNRLTENENALRALVSPGTQLLRNRVVGSRNNGILVSSSPSCILERNRVDQNVNNGILVGSSDGVVLTENRLARNGTGIILGNGNAAIATGNRVSSSVGVGIQVDAGAGHQLTENVVTKNGSHGILAAVNALTIQSNKANGNGVVDHVRDGVGLGILAPVGTPGSDNQARGNDDPAECDPASLCT